MSKAVFTPGPWKVSEDTYAGIEHTVIEGEDDFIVRVFSNKPGDVHLMAAALKMYGVLSEVYKTNVGDDKGVVFQSGGLLFLMADALATARGERYSE